MDYRRSITNACRTGCLTLYKDDPATRCGVRALNPDAGIKYIKQDVKTAKTPKSQFTTVPSGKRNQS